MYFLKLPFLLIVLISTLNLPTSLATNPPQTNEWFEKEYRVLPDQPHYFVLQFNDLKFNEFISLGLDRKFWVKVEPAETVIDGNRTSKKTQIMILASSKVLNVFFELYGEMFKSYYFSYVGRQDLTPLQLSDLEVQQTCNDVL